MFARFFRFKEQKTSLRIEITAGVTTFMTMAYILTINPSILSSTGMDKNALFTTTAIAACFATLLMAFWAKLPFALAPGLGLNAFFAYTVVNGMGYSWQIALTAVLIEGIIFIILTATNIREAIINSIPLNLKYAISAGIGLFIALLGFKNAGIIETDPNNFLKLGNLNSPFVWISLIGLITAGVFMILQIKGALLWGILISTIIGIPLGVTKFTGNIVSLPPSIEPIFFKFTFHEIFSFKMLIVVFTFLFVDMFDTLGTLIGVTTKAGMVDKNGKIPRAKEALFVDAIGTSVGAVLGTSTITTYMESAAGVTEGGRTGMTAFVVSVLFALSLFFAPLFLMVPAAATAPALILVGLFMLSPIKNADLENMDEAIPVFLTLLIMPLTMNISEGIVFGVVSFVFLKLFSGKWKQVSLVMYILSLFFILKFIL